MNDKFPISNSELKNQASRFEIQNLEFRIQNYFLAA